MAPLSIERFDIKTISWKKAFIVEPGQRSIQVPNIIEGTGMEILIFECDPDDSRSTIYSTNFRRENANVVRVSGSSEKLGVIKVLKKNESHIMAIKPDNDVNRILIRSTLI